MKEYIVRYETEQIENSEFFYGGKVECELVRCKDCIYARMTINGDSVKYCLAWQDGDTLMDSLYLPTDFYCGFAERKEE